MPGWQVEEWGALAIHSYNRTHTNTYTHAVTRLSIARVWWLLMPSSLCLKYRAILWPRKLNNMHSSPRLHYHMWIHLQTHSFTLSFYFLGAVSAVSHTHKQIHTPNICEALYSECMAWAVFQSSPRPSLPRHHESQTWELSATQIL